MIKQYIWIKGFVCLVVLGSLLSLTEQKLAQEESGEECAYPCSQCNRGLVLTNVDENYFYFDTFDLIDLTGLNLDSEWVDKQFKVSYFEESQGVQLEQSEIVLLSRSSKSKEGKGAIQTENKTKLSLKTGQILKFSDYQKCTECSQSEINEEGKEQNLQCLSHEYIFVNVEKGTINSLQKEENEKEEVKGETDNNSLQKQENNQIQGQKEEDNSQIVGCIEYKKGKCVSCQNNLNRLFNDKNGRCECKFGYVSIEKTNSVCSKVYAQMQVFHINDQDIQKQSEVKVIQQDDTFFIEVNMQEEKQKELFLSLNLLRIKNHSKYIEILEVQNDIPGKIRIKSKSSRVFEEPVDLDIEVNLVQTKEEKEKLDEFQKNKQEGDMVPAVAGILEFRQSLVIQKDETLYYYIFGGIALVLLDVVIIGVVGMAIYKKAMIQMQKKAQFQDVDQSSRVTNIDTSKIQDSSQLGRISDINQ